MQTAVSPQLQPLLSSSSPAMAPSLPWVSRSHTLSTLRAPWAQRTPALTATTTKEKWSELLCCYSNELIPWNVLNSLMEFQFISDHAPWMVHMLKPNLEKWGAFSDWVRHGNATLFLKLISSKNNSKRIQNTERRQNEDKRQNWKSQWIIEIARGTVLQIHCYHLDITHFARLHDVRENRFIVFSWLKPDF